MLSHELLCEVEMTFRLVSVMIQAGLTKALAVPNDDARPPWAPDAQERGRGRRPARRVSRLTKVEAIGTRCEDAVGRV